MKDLTLLLDKNKQYYTMYLNTKEAMSLIHKEIEEMKADYLFKIEETSMKLGVSRNEVLNLNEIIERLGKEKNKLEHTIETERKETIEGKIQLRKMIKNFKMMKQSMEMTNEELLTWRYMYDQEKINNDNITLDLEALELRVLREQKRNKIN